MQCLSKERYISKYVTIGFLCKVIKWNSLSANWRIIQVLLQKELQSYQILFENYTF